MRWQMRFGQLLLLGLLIGPRLVETVTNKPMPIDPLDLYLGYAIYPIAEMLKVF